MTKTIKYREAMFLDANIGERVYSWIDGWGTIHQIWEPHQMMEVVFEGDVRKRFYLDGRVNLHDPNPTIFWDIPTFELPRRPFDLKVEYKKLKRKKFEQSGDNYEIWLDCGTNWGCRFAVFTRTLGSYYYEKDNTEEFVEKLNKNGVTFEQLEKVIKEVENEI